MIKIVFANQYYSNDKIYDKSYTYKHIDKSEEYNIFDNNNAFDSANNYTNSYFLRQNCDMGE